MKQLIDISTLDPVKLVSRVKREAGSVSIQAIIDYLKTLPSVEVEEAEHKPTPGYWMRHRGAWTCSNCDTGFKKYDPKDVTSWDYCPRCGSKMEKGIVEDGERKDSTV